jgi:hypothetical protein|tara:strand:+ start:1392 stop:1802 length:411 start_codon:yes stop_codon:yes gene_type:complete
MKAKTFENLIRKVVREEIDYALRREIKTLKEDLRDELKPTIVEHTEKIVEIPEQTKSSLRDQIMGSQPIKQRPPQNFTSNSSLNDLLNETAQGDTNTQTATAPSIMEAANMPAPVAEAVTRDYSDLMKAITKKKGR